jgi:hypothetical protein
MNALKYFPLKRLPDGSIDLGTGGGLVTVFDPELGGVPSTPHCIAICDALMDELAALRVKNAKLVEAVKALS